MTTTSTRPRIPKPGTWVRRELPSGPVLVTTAYRDGRRVVLVKPTH